MSIYTDAEGNLWGIPVAVVAHHAAGVEVSWIGEAHAAVQPQAGDEWRAAEGTGGEFLGGSGRNWRLESTIPGVQAGWYRPSGPDAWESVRNPQWTWTRLGDGTMELSDGVDVVASAAAAGSGLSGAASAGSWTVVTWVPVGIGTGEVWWGNEDPNATVELDHTTGDAILTYGGVVMAERPGGSTSTAAGVYVATSDGENDWNGGGAWVYTVVAAGPSGTATATAYGEATYGSGGAFTVATAYEGGTEFPTRGWLLRATGTVGTEGGMYVATGWQDWAAAASGSWTLAIDGSGAGTWSDGTDVVAYRDADADRLYDPSGRWFSTVYGAATYGDGGAGFEVEVGGRQRAVPGAGWWWGELTLDAGTREVTGTAGPFTGAALPPESGTLAVVPLAWSDGTGTVRPIQTGPVQWWP